LIRAKTLHALDEVKPSLECLIRVGFHVSPALIRETLALAREAP
jgi:hypothetical protein